ncbi:hypothetical protein PIB30_069904 [Stylosanthes scabra]|uniref:Uncharacterized protein n=1 Tax=Stylosanthes scabra TaxID=79078 RepID=A0ABU6VRP2_9FABA|nr:hypothetical protein [Stylosanthes scabra]
MPLVVSTSRGWILSSMLITATRKKPMSVAMNMSYILSMGLIYGKEQNLMMLCLHHTKGHLIDQLRRGEEVMEKMSTRIRINYQGLAKFKGAQGVGRLDTKKGAAPNLLSQQHRIKLSPKTQREAEAKDRLPTTHPNYQLEEERIHHPKQLSQQKILSLDKKKKKITSQPNPTTHKKAPTAPKKPTTTVSSSKPNTASTRARKPIIAPSSQPNPLAHATPKQVVNITSSQPTTAVSGSGRNNLGCSSSQNDGKRTRFSVPNSGGPHMSPRKLRQMAKLPPSKWGNL